MYNHGHNVLRKIWFPLPHPSFSVGIMKCLGGHYTPNIEWGWGREEGLGLG